MSLIPQTTESIVKHIRLDTEFSTEKLSVDMQPKHKNQMAPSNKSTEDDFLDLNRKRSQSTTMLPWMHLISSDSVNL